MILLPQSFGPITLTRKLGTGPASETYLGTLDYKDGPRAVKAHRVLPFVRRDASRLASLESRVRDLLGVRHPFLTEVLEWLEVDEECFVVEAHSPALDLERVIQWCRQQGELLPDNVYLNLATQMCSALEVLHGRPGRGTGAENVLHLGLKPAAVQITDNAKVLVGGYSLIRSPTSQPTGGMSGPVPARMEYLSPEQTHPNQKLLPASDVFALGAIFYELLTLEPLFKAESHLQTIHRVRRAEVSQPLQRVKQRMPGLDKVLYRALSLNPRHRYQRAFVLREDLRGLMAGYSFASIADDTKAFLAPIEASMPAPEPLNSGPTAVPPGELDESAAMTASASSAGDAPIEVAAPTEESDDDALALGAADSEAFPIGAAGAAAGLALSIAGEDDEDENDDVGSDTMDGDPTNLPDESRPTAVASIALPVAPPKDSTAAHLPQGRGDADLDAGAWTESPTEQKPAPTADGDDAPTSKEPMPPPPLEADPMSTGAFLTAAFSRPPEPPPPSKPVSPTAATTPLATPPGYDYPVPRSESPDRAGAAALAAGAGALAAGALAAGALGGESEPELTDGGPATRIEPIDAATPVGQAPGGSNTAAFLSPGADDAPASTAAHLNPGMVPPPPSAPPAASTAAHLSPGAAVPPPGPPPSTTSAHLDPGGLATPVQVTPTDTSAFLSSDAATEEPPRPAAPARPAAPPAPAAPARPVSKLASAPPPVSTPPRTTPPPAAPTEDAFFDAGQTDEPAKKKGGMGIFVGLALAALLLFSCAGVGMFVLKGRTDTAIAELDLPDGPLDGLEITEEPKLDDEPVADRADKPDEREPAAPEPNREPTKSPKVANAPTPSSASSKPSTRPSSSPSTRPSSASSTSSTPSSASRPSSSTSTRPSSSTSGRPAYDPEPDALVDVGLDDPDPDELDSGMPAAPVATDLSAFSGSARAGRLSPSDVMELEMVSTDDPSFTRSRALLLMNAEKQSDPKAQRRYLDELMKLPENRYSSVYLSKQANLAVNGGSYSSALDKAKTAERYWARIPPDLVFATKADIYEVQAASYQGLFYQDGEDLELLDKAISGWERYKRHAQTKGASDMVSKADSQIGKLEDVRSRLE